MDGAKLDPGRLFACKYGSALSMGSQAYSQMDKCADEERNRLDPVDPNCSLFFGTMSLWGCGGWTGGSGPGTDNASNSFVPMLVLSKAVLVLVIERQSARILAARFIADRRFRTIREDTCDLRLVTDALMAVRKRVRRQVTGG